ncbi:peptidoglycan-binding protein [Streptomyces sp. NPDC050504]|uniref:peptidoglycan-binding protein n=1 Tax=Streptomyces sp. NPDC050504 TaxID=3365618 RepID=UPI003792DD5C
MPRGKDGKGKGPLAAPTVRTWPVACVAAVFAAGLLVAAAQWPGEAGPERRGAFSYDATRTYDCEGGREREGGRDGVRTDGRGDGREGGRGDGRTDGREGGARSAGYSPTRDVSLDRGGSGWEVVEAQCLLRRHGFDPGAVDGAYGESTEAAARHFQRARGLVADGIVGPGTWRELRR